MQTIFETILESGMTNIFTNVRYFTFIMQSLFRLLTPIVIVSSIIDFLNGNAHSEYKSKIISSSIFLNMISQETFVKSELFMAIKLYRTILKYEPENSFIWNLVGFTFTIIGSYHKGLKAFENAIIFNHKNSSIDVHDYNFNNIIPWNNIAWTYNYLEDYDKAVKAAKIAIAIDPCFAYPWNHLGYALYNSILRELNILKNQLTLMRITTMAGII